MKLSCNLEPQYFSGRASGVGTRRSWVRLFLESSQSLPNRLYHWLKNLLSLFLMLAHADLKLNKLYLQLIVHGIICCSGQFPFTNFLSINGPSRSQTSGGKRDESCLVPRPHYSTGPKRFGSRDPGENASFPPPVRLGYVTEKYWPRGTGKTPYRA